MSRFLIALVALLVTPSFVIAQTQPRRPTAAATKSLDVEAEKAQMEYLKSLGALAGKYEDAGDKDKSAEMLRAILQIKPDVQSVKDKLKEYEESVFDENNTVIDVDASNGWTNTGVLVSKDKSIRLEAIGDYKFIINVSLGPAGYESKDPATDLVSGIPTGALMAMIAPPKKGKEDPSPILIGAGKEFAPQESGILFLRLNTPPGAKCIGKVKVKLSGNISDGSAR